MKAIAVLAVLCVTACTAYEPPAAQIQPACTLGLRGCLPAYATYVIDKPHPVETSQPGAFRIRQGEAVVCD